MARASRVRAERRVKFTAVRGTLRELLAHHLDARPREVPIVYGEHGKPALDPALGSDLRFNVSHTGGLAAIALAAGREVGVDVELRRPRRRLELLARATLSPAEKEWFARLPAPDRLAAFLDLWSAKEAYSKLLGRGLQLSFRHLALAHPAAARTRVVDGGVVPPCVVHRLPVAPDHSGALAA
jgi:4'-phosphopantetheinyl transferase